LGGLVEQTHRLEKRIIKRAKDSLLGEEASRPSHAFPFLRPLTLFRFALLSTFIFILAAMTIKSQNYFSPVQKAKNFIEKRIQDIYLQVFPPLPSVLAFPLNRKLDQHLVVAKPEAEKDSEAASEEVSE
jgi:hypothetical protein